jgi:uncharacterized protein YbaR (Trm112 family)
MAPLYRDEDGSYVVCPYCVEPLTVRAETARRAQFRAAPKARKPVLCGVCGLDVTRDAPMEERVVEGRSRKACRHCRGSILKGALFCHLCRKWQSPPFER